MPFRIRHFEFEFDFTPFFVLCAFELKKKNETRTKWNKCNNKKTRCRRIQITWWSKRTKGTHVPRQKMSIREMLSPRRIKCTIAHTTVTNASTSRTNSKQYYGKDDAAINFLRRFATTTTTTVTTTMCKKNVFSTFLFFFLVHCIGPTVWQMFSIRFSHFCMSWLLWNFPSFFCTNARAPVWFRVHASVYCMCRAEYAPVFLLKFHVYLIVWWIFAVYLAVWPAFRANKIKQRKYEIRIANTANATNELNRRTTKIENICSIFSFAKILFTRSLFHLFVISHYRRAHNWSIELEHSHTYRLIEFISTYSFISFVF